MEHFNITQNCTYCLAGKKVFQVNLSLYNDDGRLNRGIESLDCFSFICHFCRKRSSLDFHRFSHPDLICHLKCLHDFVKKLHKDLDKLDVIINDINSLIKTVKEEEEEEEKKKEEEEEEEKKKRRLRRLFVNFT